MPAPLKRREIPLNFARDTLYRLRRRKWARQLYGGHWERWSIAGPEADDWIPVQVCTVRGGGDGAVEAGLMLLECEEWGGRK